MIEGVRCRLTDSEDSGDSSWSRVLIWRANVGVADCYATRTVKNSYKPSSRASIKEDAERKSDAT